MNEVSIKKFLDELASKAPTPGGGGAAALVGAVGVALGNMVGSLTVGKKKYLDVEEKIVELNAKAEILRNRFYELIEEDAKAFEPLSKVYSIPKDDPEREVLMEAALKKAAMIPMEIVRNCAKAMEVICGYAEMGSVLAISDAGCAAVLCKAAMESAALNVYINTKMMKNRELAEQLNEEVGMLLNTYCKMAMKVYEAVSGGLH